eukprot:1937046-Prymnesium_polylepis.1
MWKVDAATRHRRICAGREARGWRPAGLVLDAHGHARTDGRLRLGQHCARGGGQPHGEVSGREAGAGCSDGGLLDGQRGGARVPRGSAGGVRGVRRVRDRVAHLEGAAGTRLPAGRIRQQVLLLLGRVADANRPRAPAA